MNNYNADHQYQAQAARLADCYGAREDAVLLATASGGARTKREIRRDDLLRSVAGHLAGRQRSGAFLLREGMARVGIVDLDAHGPHKRADPLADAHKLRQGLVSLGLLPLLEMTKTAPGCRVALFFAEPVLAAELRRLIRFVVADLPYPDGIEVFPKQDSEGDGVGHAVWLPYYAPDVQEGRTVYVLPTGEVLSLDGFLEMVEETANEAATLREALAGIQDARPRPTCNDAASNPRLEPLLDCAAALPGAKRNPHGVAVCCPFHDDAVASAVIFGDTGALHCSACGRTWALRDWATTDEAAAHFGTGLLDAVCAPASCVAPVIVQASTLRRERVRWLWPNRIPLGKLTLLDGDPGLGKSLITLDLVARCTADLDMPDGQRGDLPGPAAAVVLSAEDAAEDTIRPRLDAAGADVSLVHIVTGVHEMVGRKSRERMITLGDVEALRAAIRQTSAQLVVVDPLAAYLAGCNGHRDADVRQILGPLAALASETGAAVLAVRHLRKQPSDNALYRGGGSIGVVAAARSGLLVAPEPSDASGNRRVLAATKANLSALPPALSYEIAVQGGVPTVTWGGETGWTAGALLAPRSDGTARGEARQWLADILADGPLPAADVVEAAKQDGISERTLRRARQALGVRPSKVGRPGDDDARWIWALP